MRWADDIAAFIGAVRPTAEQTRLAQRSTLEMAGYFERELLPRRRREPQDDLVTELVQARDDGRISSDAELLAQCAMLLFAGYETTRNLLGNGIEGENYVMREGDLLYMTRNNRIDFARDIAPILSSIYMITEVKDNLDDN